MHMLSTNEARLPNTRADKTAVASLCTGLIHLGLLLNTSEGHMHAAVPLERCCCVPPRLPGQP